MLSRIALCASLSLVAIGGAATGNSGQDFSQIENPLQARSKGTGLGLPLARKLAELLGGSVSVQSKPNVGSTFLVRLPLAVAAGAAQTPPAAPDALKGRSVRVLTRRPALAESLTRHAASAGLSVVCDQSDQRIDPAERQLVIADLSTHAAAVEAAWEASSRAALVVLGTPAQVQALRCHDRIEPDTSGHTTTRPS